MTSEQEEIRNLREKVNQLEQLLAGKKVSGMPDLNEMFAGVNEQVIPMMNDLKKATEKFKPSESKSVNINGCDFNITVMKMPHITIDSMSQIDIDNLYKKLIECQSL